MNEPHRHQDTDVDTMLDDASLRREPNLPAPEAERTRRAAEAPIPDRLSPANRYLELFTAVQRNRVFADSKTFADCAPRCAPRAIMKAYREENRRPDFDLRDFVHRYFYTVETKAERYHSVPGQPLAKHIAALWPVLTRHPRAHPSHASLLQLPHPYVVPGGRFGEMYYWDSYFTMLGLACTGQVELVRNIVDNLAYLIDTFGHVPNGNRNYYLSRSQPPLFAAAVELAEARCRIDAREYLSELHQEHAFWMDGSDDLSPGRVYRRLVRLPDGRLLNRYWDDRDSPREEAWAEDVATARASERDPAEVYRNIRAACESGWDFSSRWLREAPPMDRDAQNSAPERDESAPSLASICITDIAPVDLNAFLYQLESKIAQVARKDGDDPLADRFEGFAQQRKAALLGTMWDATQGAFFDYDWRAQRRRRGLTAATAAPLFVGMVDAPHAAAVAAVIQARLLAPGGLATTERRSDQQWDRPNGWAPLQWLAIRGLREYGHHTLAKTIGHRWLNTVAALYEREGKLVEKYALREVERDNTKGGGGGEYPLQDGFGWTNGVTCALMTEHPEHDAHQASAHCARPVHA